MSNPRNIKLNIKPIYVTMHHQYVFEGPCRAGSGEQLTTAYDDMEAAKKIKKTQNEIDAAIVPNQDFHLLDSYWVKRNEDFLVSEKIIDEMLADNADTDVYLIETGTRLTDILIPFAQKANKPLVLTPDWTPMQYIAISSLRARGIECYAFLSWKETLDCLDAIRARKVLANTRVLCVSRYGSTRSVSGIDNFVNLEHVTDRLGTNFVFSNIHEFLDQMHPLQSGKNYTLPGRNALNPTEEDMVEINRIADEIIAGAEECTMEREEVVRSTIVYYVVNKMLNFYECNAFTAICPDACATRRLNEERFTFCMTHSLLNGLGIPAACEYDIPAVLSKMILGALGHKPTYMGNTNATLAFDQASIGVGMNYEHQNEKKYPENTVLTWHAVTNLHMHGFDTPTEPYLVHPFTASGFGVTLRYDFARDVGTEVTMCRLDPNCDKIFVAKGKVVGCEGYTDDSCSIGVYLEVADQNDFFQKQLSFGNHVPLVYGDCFDKVCALGKMLGLEVVTA